MTDLEKRDTINKTMRYIAIKIFNHHHGEPNYIRSYDKLLAQCRLQWNLDINDRLDRLNKTNIFDVLDGDELDLVYQSSIKLRDMYGNVLKREGIRR